VEVICSGGILVIVLNLKIYVYCEVREATYECKHPLSLFFFTMHTF
jgi:hypothetical protein